MLFFNRKSEVTSDMIKADLIKIHDHLIERGWIQGPFESEQGVCLAQATRIILGNEPRYHAVRDAIRDLVGLSIIMYNEEEGRTKEQVLDMLKRASGKEYSRDDIKRYLDV